MKNIELKNKLILVTYGVLLFVFLINYQWFTNIFGFIGRVFMPFIIGVIIAFILNVLVNIIEKKWLKKFKNCKRILSVIFSLIIIFGFIVILMFILIPQLKNAGMIFVENIPEYQKNLYSFGETIGLTEKQLDFLDLEDNKILDELSVLVSENSKVLIDASMGFVNSLVSAIGNFFVGLVFAIYVLLEKENLSRQICKLLKKIFSKKIYDKVLEVSRLINVTFSNFVKVQVLEACILGLLCFFGMLVFGLPYAATISVLIGFTALIPIFGAFIGCAIGAFLIFMISPIQSLIFIVFFLVLQQIEGNFIYPKVVGGKIGLPSIWVLVAVMVGGSVGGIFGMLIGVPVVSVIYALLKKYVNGKKEVKDIEV